MLVGASKKAVRAALLANLKFAHRIRSVRSCWGLAVDGDARSGCYFNQPLAAAGRRYSHLDLSERTWYGLAAGAVGAVAKNAARMRRCGKSGDVEKAARHTAFEVFAVLNATAEGRLIAPLSHHRPQGLTG